MNTPTRNNSAFTLMETLIAMAIIAVIVSAIYGSYCASANSINRCQGKLDTTRQAQLLLDTITRQIRTAYAPEIDKPESKKYFNSNKADSSDIILQLITTSGIDQTTEYKSPVQATYKYNPAEGIIYYYQEKNIYNHDSSKDYKNQRILAENITSIELTFFDGKKYHKQWPVPDSKKLPRAVKIDITFGGTNKTQPKNFTTVACVSGNSI